ncbi:MAG: hypothetical protein HUJ68_13900 [Clostridia bacterium]|nr:hypothetical protein [Clostridia bacterium]
MIISTMNENGEYEDKKVYQQQPPFDFDKEVITQDTKLYAVFIPKVTVHFMSEDGSFEYGHEHLMVGDTAYNPLSDNIVAGVNKPGKDLVHPGSPIYKE